jgi:Xaa-Pro dipeptidase
VTDRRARLQNALAPERFGALLLVSPPNIAYVCGFRPTPFERLIALVVPPDGPLRLVVPSLDEEGARAQIPEETALHVWRDEDGPAAALAAALAGLEPPVGIEKAYLTISQYEVTQDALPGARFGDCGSLLERLRAVKDEDELTRLRQAAAVVDRAVERLRPELRPGRSEAELAARAAALLREEGGERLAFEPAVLAGEKSALPHGQPDDNTLAEGDLVIVDIGASVGGYCADITRTFVAGREPDARQLELFQVVGDAHAAGVRAAVAGATGADVDRAARSVIDAAGLGEHFVHRTGHGLGLEVHEPPSLHSANHEPLAAGAVITVEPGVYIRGYGGVRIEDDLVVGIGQPELLTRAPIRLEAV